jgi:hypothetical protein
MNWKRQAVGDILQQAQALGSAIRLKIEVFDCLNNGGEVTPRLLFSDFTFKCRIKGGYKKRAHASAIIRNLTVAEMLNCR